jgi:O-antigen/teichoic acid export membrane protein
MTPDPLKAGRRPAVRERLGFGPADATSPQGRSRERYRRIMLSTASNFLARGLSLAVNLLVIRLVLGRLGKAEYGVWVAITAFLMWSTLLDFGILNSLVNAVAEANGRDERETIRRHLATALFTLLGVAAALAAFMALLVGVLNWSSLFSSAAVVSERTLRWSIAAAVVPFIAGIPLAVVRQVYAGLQKTYVSNAFLVLSSLLTAAAVWGAAAAGAGLPWLVLASGIGPPLAALLQFIYLVQRDMPWLKPRLGCFARESLRRLLRSSAPLFLFQFGALLVNYSQPFILAHATSYAVVADYSLLLRIYLLAATVIVLSTSSFFPAFREAHERGDRSWVRRNFRRMLGLRMGLAGALGLGLVLAGNGVLSAWLGRDAVAFHWTVWALLAWTLLVNTWATSFSDLLTIMDRIWIQVVVVLANGAVTVALTAWLAPGLGVLGALVAYSLLPLVVWSWLGPLSARTFIAPPARPSIPLDGPTSGYGQPQ